MAGTYLCNKFCNYSDLHIFCKDIGSPSGDQSKTVKPNHDGLDLL